MYSYDSMLCKLQKDCIEGFFDGRVVKQFVLTLRSGQNGRGYRSGLRLKFLVVQNGKYSLLEISLSLVLG